MDGSNVTITPVTPYLAAEGELSQYFHYYLGWRRDEISTNNQDLVTPANSWNKLVGLNSPKATLTFFPKDSWYDTRSRRQLWEVVLHGRPQNRVGTGQQTATGAPRNRRSGRDGALVSVGREQALPQNGSEADPRT